MIRFNRIYQRAALCALLLCISQSSIADDILDANKLFKQGQYAQALTKVDVLLAARPKDSQARFLKGLILTEQGQTDDAARIFTALTEDYPDLPEPYNNLAVLYASQGQYEKAKIALEKAIRTHPSYSTAHENLGDIYAKMASQAYDRALQLDRSSASSKTKLSLIKDLFTPVSKLSDGKVHLASNANPPASASPATKPASASKLPVPLIVAASVPAVTTTHPIASSEPALPKPAVVATSTADSKEDVLKAMHEWSAAWASKKMNKYLAMYAKNFETPDNLTRNQWEQQRRERIVKPQAIIISISNPKVELIDDTHATVSFIQSYRSGSLKSTTRKMLEMIKTSGSWQIQSEQTGIKR